MAIDSITEENKDLVGNNIQDILLSDKLESPSILVNKYSFTLKKIEFSDRITVSVFYDLDRKDKERDSVLEPEPYRFSLSHYIRTPLQSTPHHTDDIYSKTEYWVLKKAIFYYTGKIDEAVKNNHIPNNDWLIKNDSL